MRRTLAETKELLLRTGLSELHERGLFVAVTHVRLAEVAKAADLTTGAAYRVWGNQEDFHRDLAVAAVRFRDENILSRTIQRIHKAVDDGAPLREVLRIGAHAHLHVNRPTDPFLIALSLRAQSGADPALTVAARARHDESMAAFEQLYQAMLTRYGRRIRPGLDLAALSHALAAVTEGFALQSLSGIDHPTYELDDPDPAIGREWTLVALTVDGIVDHFTEPVPDAPDAPDADGAAAATGFEAAGTHP